MSANGICTPITIILGMFPAFGTMKESIQRISKLFYTTRFADTVAQIIYNETVKLDYKIVLTYIFNFMICIAIFSFVYKTRKLDD